jgi:hypothetical protein
MPLRQRTHVSCTSPIISRNVRHGIQIARFTENPALVLTYFQRLSTLYGFKKPFRTVSLPSRKNNM